MSTPYNQRLVSRTEITLRDLFAAFASHALVLAPGQLGDESRQNESRCAEWAYSMADAMLAAREAKS